MLLFSLPLSNSSAQNIYNPVIKARSKLNNSLIFLIKLSNSKLIHKHSCRCQFVSRCSTETSTLHRQAMMEQAEEIIWTSRSSLPKKKGDHTFAVFPLHEILVFFVGLDLEQNTTKLDQSSWKSLDIQSISTDPFTCLSLLAQWSSRQPVFCLYRALMSADTSRLHGLLFLNF